MNVRLVPFDLPADAPALVDFLTGNNFPFHVGQTPTREQAEQRIASGSFRDHEHDSFWLVDDELGRVGYIRLEDLQDPSPMLDLRLADEHRGKGLGAAALRAAADHVFTTLSVERFEGCTREDNVAMRRTFEKAGWVQEAHFRRAWPVTGAEPKDAVNYSILRQDWESDRRDLFDGNIVTMTDAHLAAAKALVDWAKPDGWRTDARSVVALEGDRVVGTAICMPNLVHTVRLSLFVQAEDESVRAALVDHFRHVGLGPFAVKADRFTAEHSFWTSLGAFPYQVCPSQCVDVTTDAARAWAHAQQPASDVQLTRCDALPVEDVVAAITQRYCWQHMSWSPMTSRDAVEGVMREEVSEGTDLDGSFATLRDGRITAICDLYTDEWGETRVCCAEAVDPSSPGARADVAAVMAAVMRHVAELGGKPVLMFDGHVTDPHFAGLLRTIPGVFGDVCELLEVP